MTRVQNKVPEVRVNALSRIFFALCLLSLMVWRGIGAEAAAAVEKPKPPKLVIRGLGLLDNRKLKRTIQQTYPEEKRDQPYDANFIEDSFVILRNQLQVDGFQEAVIHAELTLVDGEILELDWDGKSELEVPRPLAVRKAYFKADEGPLFHYTTFEIEGLTAIPAEQATGFFFKTDMLLKRDRNRRFSTAQLSRSLANLRQELVNLGYSEAVVALANPVEQDLATGDVHVRIKVEQGKMHHVSRVEVQFMDDAAKAVETATELKLDAPWSPIWQQDFTMSLRNEQFRLGRPDARAIMERVSSNVVDGVVQEELKAVVEPGEEVRLGEVKFEGQKKTRLSWLEKKGKIEGPLLDRLKVDAARERLSQQGVFDFVGVRYEPPTGPERDVVFELNEGKRIDFSLLAGYGSYDQFFGGAELDQYNLWGVGHNAKLRGMLSTKTANAVYTYSIPEFLTRNLSLFANADGLLRQELTFKREEIKTAIGLRKVFPVSRFQVGARYSYQFLKTQDSPDAISNDEFVRVAAIILDAQLERRDNPLAPRKGYRLYGNVEIANPVLGSQAEYELLQIGASGHVPINRSLVLHAALQHGVIFSPDPAVDIPFNKRYLNGGENSVRGYKQGGASPYNTQGQQLGAETFLLGNLELEQYLTERWSVVAFIDGVGNSADLSQYPFNEVLWSVGGGIRWNTIIGPVRAEYGYNLDPRSFDPVGTLHIAIGFPF